MSKGTKILERIAKKATKGTGMPDPESMTVEQQNAWWRKEYLKFANEDLARREALAKRLQCPAAWSCIMTELNDLLNGR